MILDTINAVSLAKRSRLDAKFFLSPGVRAASRLDALRAHGISFVRLGGEDGVAKAWSPARFRKEHAAPKEESVAYLRPYDVFEYLPEAADLISVSRTEHLDGCRLHRGMILQTCSGRNLGPAVFVDDYLAKFVVGADMIRITVDDEDTRYYVLAFLLTTLGQNLLTQGKTGSVIDHLSAGHINGLEVPLLPDEVRREIIDQIRTATTLRESARMTLDRLISEYESRLPSTTRTSPTKDGWTITASSLSTRIDAACYDPVVSRVRSELKAMGGIVVSEVADVLKPPGRYKTYYVTKEHGRPLLSGTQALQATPINLRYMSPIAFKDISAYEVHTGWILYQADGRAEETLGLPAMITRERDGWLASGHVGRVVAHEDVDLGWLYLALRTSCAQIQIKALASGSVVDSTFPFDMETVVLPPTVEGIDFREVLGAWEAFADAQEAERHAVNLFERTVAELADAPASAVEISDSKQ